MIRTFLCALFALSLQANAAVVGFNPTNSSVGLGDIFVVGVEGSAFASDLDGGGLNLSFDPTRLEVLDVIVHPDWDFFLPGDDGVIDNVAGSVTNTRFNQFAHPKVGSFAILEYQFRAKALGSSLLQLTAGDNPFGSLGGVVQVSFTDGSVNVVPEPSTVSMLLAGLLVAFGMSRRLKAQK